MKKKPLGIILAIIITTSFLAGCGEHIEENGAEEIYESEAEISQTDRQTEVPMEVEEAPQTANSNETEEIISSIENEPDEDNGEESVEPFIDDENFILERERAEGLIFYVDISFPQLESNIYPNVEELNSLLKDAAFAFYGMSSEDALLLLEKEKDDIPDFSLHVDYDVLHVGNDYISVVFTVDGLTGGPSVMHQYLVTVDMKSGEYIYFDNLVIIDQVLKVLQLGNFKVYAGTYFEFDDDAHEPDIIEQFIKIFKEQVSVGIPEAAFDRFSSQNIGLDKDFLYIYFPAKGIWSFHDYYILCIPRKELVFYIDI